MHAYLVLKEFVPITVSHLLNNKHFRNVGYFLLRGNIPTSFYVERSNIGEQDIILHIFETAAICI